MHYEVFLDVAHADKVNARDLMVNNLLQYLTSLNILELTDMHAECSSIFRICRSVHKLRDYRYSSCCTI